MNLLRIRMIAVLAVVAVSSSACFNVTTLGGSDPGEGPPTTGEEGSGGDTPAPGEEGSEGDTPAPGEEGSGPVDGSTLVFNGTFESGLSGWNQAEPASGSSDAATGEGAGKVEPGGSISQTVGVAPDSDYTLSVSLKLDADEEPVEDVAGTSSIIVGDTTIPIDPPSETNLYETFEVEFNSGSSEEATILFEGGDVRVDDVVLEGPFPAGYSDPNEVFDWTLWELEGESPVVGNALAFDALDQFVMTPNGNGARHEAKIKATERYPIAQQFEQFAATVTPELSAGAETIVLQWHPEGLATLNAIYVADINEDAELLKNTESGEAWLDLENGIAGDGIFDVIMITRAEGATELLEAGLPPTQSFGGSFQETGQALGTIESGESFDIDATNENGNFIINTVIGGVENEFTQQSDASSNSYLKFGSYLQARNSDTFERVLTVEDKEILTIEEKEAAFRSFYTEQNITEAKVTFENTTYTRVLDDGATQVPDEE